MSVTYEVKPNALTSPPSYTCKPIANAVLGYDEMATKINTHNPTIPIQVARAVLEAFREEVKIQLADGNTVNLNGFCSFVVTMPVRLAAPSDPLPSNALDIAAKPAKPFKDAVRQAATYNRQATVTKAPSIKSAYDTNTGVVGFIRENMGFRINGSNLKFSPTDALQGVFLMSPAGNEIKQTNISLSDPSNIIITPVFDTEAGPAGTASVENELIVKAKYTTNGQLRTGTYGQKLRALNVISDSTSDQLFVVGDAATGPAKVKTYSGSQVMCKIVAQIKPNGDLVLSAGTLAGELGDQVTVSGNADYTLVGVGSNVVVQVTNATTLRENVMGYSRYLQEVCDLSPLTP